MGLLSTIKGAGKAVGKTAKKAGKTTVSVAKKTGSTIKEITKVLKRNGAKEVYGLTIAG